MGTATVEHSRVGKLRYDTIVTVFFVKKKSQFIKIDTFSIKV